MLSEILRTSAGGLVPPELLVGIETADDAAVYQLNDEQALIATTDFFMPIVDDPFDFGRIAATNAISDVYAMGGKPIMALALVAMPIDVLPVEQIGAVIRGGESVCRAGRHPDRRRPHDRFGRADLRPRRAGPRPPDKVRRNADAKAGDVLVLGKPIGVGVMSAALKKDALDAAGYEHLIATTTRLNTPGIALADLAGVHAMTDVTGFGLAGHALELARGAKLGGDDRLVEGAAAGRRRGAGARRLRHRRVGPQLGRLRRRGRRSTRRCRRSRATAHRSADLRRPARQLRPGGGRRGARGLPRPGLRRGGGDRLGRPGLGPARRRLTAAVRRPSRTASARPRRQARRSRRARRATR